MSVRTTFTLDEQLAAHAKSLGVNLSAAARRGVEDAVRRARAEADAQAYRRHPEAEADEWADVEAWGQE